ncbi:MAG TPA: hypothetical protein VML55_11420 [Planctomycetaceae bacterium]|nr:hypothetical protein [Planctomycetaceae bacterium]
MRSASRVGRFRRPQFVAGLCAAALFLPAAAPLGSRPAAAASAQDLGLETTMKMPLVVFNVAGVERLLGDVKYMFTAIERPEIFETLEGLLGNVGNLRGLDRTKPFGVMLYVELGFPPRPEPVAYLPASDIDQLMRTMNVGPLTTRKIGTGEGRYEIEIPERDGRQALQARLINGYVFIARTAEVLDRDFPDPATFTSALTSRYDLAVRADLDSVPKGMKTLFLDYLRAETEAQLQQRDGEPDAQYQMRRLGGMNNLELLEGLLTDGKDLTFGIDASAENQRVAVEFAINAAPDSKFAKQLTDLGGRRSYFTAALDEQVPLAASASWASQKREQERNAAALDTIEKALAQRLQDENIDATGVADVFTALRATNEGGHFDAFVRMAGSPPGPFVLVGGLRVQQGRTLARGVTSLLNAIPDKPPALEMNADSHNGVTFHRLVFADAPPPIRRVFGEQPAFYAGAASDAVWFALGGTDAMPSLREAMNRVAEATAAGVRARETAAPFRLIVRTSNWLGFGGEQDTDRQMAEQAFAKGQDTLTVEVRPTDSGVRTQIVLEEGFIRWLGLQVARNFDRRSQERP